MTGRKEQRTPPSQGFTNPIDAGLLVTACALLGARAAFVGSHWTYYSLHIPESLWFWQGGLSWVGGAVGVLVGMCIFSGIKGQPLAELADWLAMPLAIVATASWLGCLLDGCAYGREISTSLAFLNRPDLFGQIAPRWPTQLLGVLYSAFTILILLYTRDRLPRTGSTFLLAVLLISGGLFGLSMMRGDPARCYGDLRMDALAAGVIFTGALLVMIWSRKRWKT